MKERYVNEKRLKEYKQYKVLRMFGWVEAPLLPWKFYIHHTEEEIEAAEKQARIELKSMLEDL